MRGRRGRGAAELHAILEKSYAKEPFVHVLPLGEMPQTRHVRGSNMTMIGVAADRVAGRAPSRPSSRAARGAQRKRADPGPKYPGVAV